MFLLWKGPSWSNTVESRYINLLQHFFCQEHNCYHSQVHIFTLLLLWWTLLGVEEMLGSTATINTNKCTIWSINKTFFLEQHLQPAATKKGNSYHSYKITSQQQQPLWTTNLFQLLPWVARSAGPILFQKDTKCFVTTTLLVLSLFCHHQYHRHMIILKMDWIRWWILTHLLCNP